MMTDKIDTSASAVVQMIDVYRSKIDGTAHGGFHRITADMIEALRAERDSSLAAQPYTYIGKDMKPVLARDLEDQQDALREEVAAEKENTADWMRACNLSVQEATALKGQVQGLRAEVERLREGVAPRVLCLPYPMHGYGVCVGGRFDGWLMWHHPDGQWVTKGKLDSVDPSLAALKGGDA